MDIKTVTYTEQLNSEIAKLPGEYLPNLLQIIRLFRKSVTLKTAEESFSEGWKEAMSGEVHPVSELWNGINAD
jgi:hypothetical protein